MAYEKIICGGAATSISAIDASCHASIGGIKEILIANRDDVNFGTIQYDGDYKVINGGITMAENKYFEHWKFRKNTGAYTSTASLDPVIGTNFFTTEVTLQFSRAEAEKRLTIQSAINANAVVIVRDMYDQYILLGLENDVNVTAAVMQSGTANTDLSGFTLTLTDISSELPYFIDKELVEDLSH